jgi:hypothetical protein
MEDMSQVYNGRARRVALSDLLHKVNAFVQLLSHWFIVTGFAGISLRHYFSQP